MNEIDEIFKQASLSKREEFKPEYWEEFQQSIIPTKKKKRRFLFFLLSMGILLTIGTLSIVKNISEKSKLQSITEVESNSFTAIKENNFPTSTSNSLATQTEKTNDRANELFDDSKPDKTVSIRPIRIKTYPINSDPIYSKIPIVKNEISNSSALPPLKLETVNKDKIESETEISEEIKDDSDEDNFEPENKQTLDSTAIKSVVKNPFQNSHKFNFVFGISTYKDVNLANNPSILKAGLSLGIEYEYLLKPNLSVSTGILLNNRVSDNAKLFFNNQNNGFGELEKQTTYSYTDFYFVEIPVTLNYIINSKHKLGAGPTYTRLISTKYKKIEKGNTTTKSKNDVAYHLNTFSQNNYGLNLFYQYNFKQIGINLGYTYGLNNYVNFDTFQTNTTNRLSKLQLSIKYNI
ncbi:MAG: hypothetical protein ACPGVD_09845 [Flavobacteriales bacterium]